MKGTLLMKRENKLKSLLLTPAIALALLLFSAMTVSAQTYNTGDIAVINAIINNNGLGWTVQIPADGSAVDASWTGVTWSADATNKRITALALSNVGLNGTLDVSGLAALERLNCNLNSLTGTLDVSGLTALWDLDCANNSLTGLNISGLTNLSRLQFYNNSLTGTLDVSGFANMTLLECSDNFLTGVTLNATASYTWIEVRGNLMANESAVTGQTITWDGVNFFFSPQRPILTAGTVSRTSNTTATVTFNSTEAGDYFYQLDGAAPTAGSLVSAGTNQTPMNDGANTIDLTLTNGAHTLYIEAIEAGWVYESNLLTISIPAFNPPPPPTPAGISGPISLTLPVGYAATSTDAFTITGTTPVTVTKISGNDRITWNNSTRRLDIAAGLAAGVYEVRLRASNVAPNMATFTFTLTVQAPVYYLNVPTTFTGGAVAARSNNANPYLAEEGSVVTLTIAPDAGYVLSSIVVHKLDDGMVVVPLSGSGLVRTFTMPAHHITIAAVFTTTVGIEDVGVSHTPLRAYAQDGILYVSGLTAGQSFSVYNIVGTTLYQGIASADKANLPLPLRGVYIVTDGKTVVKVVN